MSDVLLRLILKIFMLIIGVFFVILLFPILIVILLILFFTGHLTVLRNRANIFSGGFRRNPENESQRKTSVSDGDTIDAEVIHAETVEKDKD